MRSHAQILLSLVAVLAGCSRGEPGIYEVSRAEAWQRLQQADLPAFIAARGCGVALDIATQPDTLKSLRWTVRAEGAELVHFGVRIEDAGAGKTRAQIDIPFNPNLTETLTAVSGAPALRQPLQGAVVELVDAALAARSFDPAKTGDDRLQVDACKARPRSTTPVASRPSSSRPAAAFGSPTMATGAAPEVARVQTPLGPNGEQQLEDLPRPGR